MMNSRFFTLMIILGAFFAQTALAQNSERVSRVDKLSQPVMEEKPDGWSCSVAGLGTFRVPESWEQVYVSEEEQGRGVRARLQYRNFEDSQYATVFFIRGIQGNRTLDSFVLSLRYNVIVKLGGRVLEVSDTTLGDYPAVKVVYTGNAVGYTEKTRKFCRWFVEAGDDLWVVHSSSSGDAFVDRNPEVTQILGTFVSESPVEEVPELTVPEVKEEEESDLESEEASSGPEPKVLMDSDSDL